MEGINEQINNALSLDVFRLISKLADENKDEVYVIGGFVRDVFLQRPNKDIDILVIGNGIAFAKALASKIGQNVHVTVFKNFGTAMIQYNDLEIEIVGARKESYRRDSRKPIIESGSLLDDQNRRDFTINAMAFCLNSDRFGELIDPFNGLHDLEVRKIVTPLDPDLTFSDDPLRMLRGIRFSTQLNFKIDDECLESIKRNAERIHIVSIERIMDEFNKILQTPRPSAGIKLLETSGLLPLFFPEFSNLKGVESKDGIRHKDNFYHTLQVLDNLCEKSDDIWLRWAALLHDIAKPPTKRFVEGIGWTFHGHEFLGAKMTVGIFRRLHLPLNEKLSFVRKMVLLHLRPIALVEDHVTDSAVRRLLFDAGDDVDDLMLLAEADITSKNEKKVQRFLRNFKVVRKKLREIEEKDAIRNFQPPVSGELIMECFDIPPSKEVGQIKDSIKEAILDGIIQNNFEEAYQFMIAEGKKLGLHFSEPQNKI